MNDEEAKGIDLWKTVMDSLKTENLELGPYWTYLIKNDIRHMLFSFARYKFAARLMGDNPLLSVLELGCNEGLGTLHLAQTASHTVAVDFDATAIDWAQANLARDGLSFFHKDFLGYSFGKFDVVVSLDVIEHIEPENENLFLETVLDNLNDNGFAVIGTPNITASPYASEASMIGHINLYDHQRLKDLFRKGFYNVFLFGMNDEVVHTGFLPMCHYIFIVACNKR